MVIEFHERDYDVPYLAYCMFLEIWILEDIVLPYRIQH